MATASTVPLSITPEAADYIDNELRMRPEFERMLDYVRNHVDNLGGILVRVQPPYDDGGDPAVIITALYKELPAEPDGAMGRFGDWQLETFPKDVHMHFVMTRGWVPNDAR